MGEDARKKPEIDAEIEFDDIEGNSRSVDTDGGVKVLSEKTGSGDNFYYDRFDTELVPASIGNLLDEITGLLHQIKK